MLSRQIRRSVAILALSAAASVIFPLSDLSAAPRSESRWGGHERSARIVPQGFSFWSFLTSLFEKARGDAGAGIDGNG
ncbi:MAG TPA: hypothetical protein VNW71_04785 [Thermoanaerobaculia bacterium]|nr:hypothetical protein [Thermoanaerobaculia bacterium]